MAFWTVATRAAGLNTFAGCQMFPKCFVLSLLWCQILWFGKFPQVFTDARNNTRGANWYAAWF